MPFITLLIDNRVNHVVRFHPKGEKRPYVDTFIIERKQHVETQLFAFYHYAENCNPEAFQDNDIVLQTNKAELRAYIESMNASEEAGGVLRLSVRLKVSVKPIPLDETLDENIAKQQLIFCHGEKSLWPVLLKGESYKSTLRVHLCISLQETDCEAELLQAELMLVVADKTDIVDAALDFGSEASQMSISNREDSNGGKPWHELFNAMLRQHKPDKVVNVTAHGDDAAKSIKGNSNYIGEADVSDFEQRESESLFRTIFYGRNNVPTEDPLPHQGGLNSHFVRMLTSDIEGQELRSNGSGFFLLPTVKLMHLAHNLSPNVCVEGEEKSTPVGSYAHNYFYRACINQFVLLVLKQMCSANKQYRRTCLHLRVLMPNVYSISDTIQHLQYMKEDIATMLADESMNFSHINGVEVSVISESDASLLGNYYKLQSVVERDLHLDSGNYLVIDSGRGTTDFSVLNYNAKERIYSRNFLRSGVVGAGGVITYAYLLAFVYDILRYSLGVKTVEESHLRSYIQLILHGDSYYVNRIMMAVEKYKRACNENYKNIPFRHDSGKIVQSAEQIELPKFADMAEAMCNTERQTITQLSIEAQRYVDAATHSLVETIVKGLERVKRLGIRPCRKVLLAGRAFKHKDFKQKLLNALQQSRILPSKEDVELLAEDGLDPKEACLNCTHEITKTYQNAVMSMPQIAFDRRGERTIQWRDRFLMKIYDWKQSDKRFKRYSGVTCHWLYELFLRLHPSDFEAENLKRNGMVSGYLIETRTATDEIVVGSTIYHHIPEGKYKLFFNGEDLFLRDKGGHHYTLSARPTSEPAKNLIFATLFPNIDDNGANTVWIPETTSNSEVSLSGSNKGTNQQYGSTARDSLGHRIYGEKGNHVVHTSK